LVWHRGESPSPQPAPEVGLHPIARGDTEALNSSHWADGGRSRSLRLIVPGDRILCDTKLGTTVGEIAYEEQVNMNAEYVQKALEKVGNPNTLVNLISRRVRQLNAGGRALSGSSVAITAHMGVADIALLEIIDGRMGWEVPDLAEWSRPVRKTQRSSKPRVKALRAA